MTALVATTISSRSALDRPGRLLVHQRVVHREEGPRLVGPPGERREDVGQEARPLLDVVEPLGEVGRQLLPRRHREAADRRVAHPATVPRVRRLGTPGTARGHWPGASETLPVRHRPTAGRLLRRLHDGTAAAATAEQLMRSRYSAFVLGDAGYLLDTWHPTTRPTHARPRRPRPLDRPGVLATTGGSLLAAEGTVEFRAPTSARARPGAQHENSRFLRDGGRWRYLDGVSLG